MSDQQPTVTLAELATLLGGTLHGSAEAGRVRIRGINTLAEAGSGDVTLIINDNYAKLWGDSKAAAAIVSETVKLSAGELDGCPDARPLIVVKDAELASVRLLEMFQLPAGQPPVGVHPSAVVDKSAVLGLDVRIGAHVSIERGCRIGNGVVLHAGVRLYGEVTIGDGTVLHANVVVRDRCRIGRRAILHQNVSIGADGFGYRPDSNGRLVKIPHIGNVVIEDDVEIGANSCVDRGKFGSTVIGTGTKIDNLCQIAHNCRIGRNCIIAAQTGIAGSTVVGDGVQMGGQVGVLEHLTIGNCAKIAAKTGISKDIPPDTAWVGYPAGEYQAMLRHWAMLRKLPDILRRLGESSGASPGAKERP
jgi:UDP-3-O-[3-hydroxymyristoyl] glucosamine N-acyltransferase